MCVLGRLQVYHWELRRTSLLDGNCPIGGRARPATHPRPTGDAGDKENLVDKINYWVGREDFIYL